MADATTAEAQAVRDIALWLSFSRTFDSSFEIQHAAEGERTRALAARQQRETARVEWNRTAERVESVSALWFEQIVIEESRSAPDPEAAMRARYPRPEDRALVEDRVNAAIETNKARREREKRREPS